MTTQQTHSDEPTVTITVKEYEELQKDSHWLACLDAAGVDNWCGYDHAQSIAEEWAAEELEESSQ